MESKIIWLTGLSGSGKSTLSKKLYIYLKKKNYCCKIVDGDIFRNKINRTNNFSRRSIISNNIKIIRFIKKYSKKFDFIIVAVISPLRQTRNKAKKIFKNNYYEVYVKCSLKKLKQRDTKDLYKKADEKIIKNLIGYNSKIKYEISKYRKITVDTDKMSIQASVKKILNKVI